MTRRTLALTGLIVSLLAGACGSSSFRYVTSKKTGTYFKVPANWKVFDQKTINQAIRASGNEPPPEVLFAAAFDASPKPALANFPQEDPPPHQPTGIARVFVLDDTQHDLVSLAALRNMLVAVDDGVAQSKINVLGQVDLAPPGGLHGQRLVFEVKPDTGPKYIVDQSALIDAKAKQVWVFAVGCESSCYMAQRSKIDKVVSSWTVKKR